MLVIEIRLDQRRPLGQPGFILRCRFLDIHKGLGKKFLLRRDLDLGGLYSFRDKLSVNQAGYLDRLFS